MCGIFGYIGKQDTAAELVLDGLKLLEYRGYDSWGVAVKVGKEISIDKHVGKIGNATVNLPKSNLGIGHTRWATHGGVTRENSHPHLDCTKKLALIHNGIVENYQILKEELLKKDHVFVSETDTEVIVHLIEENIKTNDFSTAVRISFNRLDGLNAIVIANADSKEIIAAKNGSPLVVGEKDGDFYLASDFSGIVKHTTSVLFLKDNEMVILGDGIQLLSLSTGEKIVPEFEVIDWKVEDVDKGEHEHFMIKEIYDQAKVITNIANTYTESIEELAEVMRNAVGTFFIGAGTAFHACLVGVYLFSKIAKKHINTSVASEFNYLEDFLTDKSLIMAFSQSGETIDVIEPLSRAKEKGSKIVAITNVLGSSIYRMAHHKLLLGAGPEKAVASTKAYIAKLSIVIMLAYGIQKETKKAKELLLHAAKEVDRLLEKEQVDHIKKLSSIFKNAKNMYVIGRGVSYPSALEAALKIKEVSYIHTEGLAGGELKHGTIALISKGTPCIVFAPNDETYSAMISNATEIRSRGGVIIGVSHKNAEVFDHFIEVKDMGEATVVAQIIPIQLFSYFLAIDNNCDPDKPRNLAKSVTVK